MWDETPGNSCKIQTKDFHAYGQLNHVVAFEDTNVTHTKLILIYVQRVSLD